MPKKILLRTLAAALIAGSSCSVVLANSPTSQTDKDHQVQETMNARIESAQSILDDVHDLKASMRAFHRKANEVIAQSKRLQGQAEVLLTKTPVLPAAVKLTPAQYQAALKQYNGDLDNFALHAGAYDQHLKTFQATVGECHANEQALNSVIQKYEIHADQFHLPLPSTLRPPHICGHMRGGVGQIASEANSMMMDQKRVLESQLALAKTEANLQNAEGEMVGTHTKAVNEAKREEGEQALAGEFSRLKNEYDLLKIEKDQLAGHNSGVGKVTHSSVSAKVKKN